MQTLIICSGEKMVDGFVNNLTFYDVIFLLHNIFLERLNL